MRRYLIIGNQRSGTTAIHVGIAYHPQISSLYDEIKVQPFFTKGLWGFTVGNNEDMVEERKLAFDALFNAMALLHASENTTVIGMKCCTMDPSEARLLVESLRQNFSDVKIVLVIREDLVAQFGSNVSARLTGRYHSLGRDRSVRRKEKEWADSKLKLNKWGFVEYAIKCLETNRILRELHDSHQVLEVIYEEFFSNEEDNFRRLFNFLDVPAISITWMRASKVMPPADQYIKNYRQLSTILGRLKEHLANNPGTFSYYKKYSGVLRKLRTILRKFVTV
jgi:hypothetical protein